MLSLIYVSSANERLTMAMVEAMVERAAQSNAADGITGMLAYDTSRFMQLLEGDEDAVLTTMRRITRDPRHRKIEYLRDATRDQRECPDWSMKPLLVPLSGKGSAERFASKLPRTMRADTRLLFTSFAASVDERPRVTPNSPSMGAIPHLNMAMS